MQIWEGKIWSFSVDCVQLLEWAEHTTQALRGFKSSQHPLFLSVLSAWGSTYELSAFCPSHCACCHTSRHDGDGLLSLWSPKPQINSSVSCLTVVFYQSHRKVTNTVTSIAISLRKEKLSKEDSGLCYYKYILCICSHLPCCHSACPGPSVGQPLQSSLDFVFVLLYCLLLGVPIKY